MREVRRLQQIVECELELKGKQFVSDLKTKIEGLLSNKIIETNTQEALTDANFRQTAILEVLKSWKINEDLELILPSVLEERIKGAFTHRIKEHTPNLSIVFENRLPHLANKRR